MANRRCIQTLIHQYTAHPFLQSLKNLIPTLHQTISLPNPPSPQCPDPISHQIFSNFTAVFFPQYQPTCHFSSRRSDNEEEEDDEDDGNDDEGSDDYESVSASNCGGKRKYTKEEKEEEAEAIGYKVVGPLRPSERVFKPYEPVFAVVQIGSHQFKVSNGDSIFTERLKFCEVNNKLILNKVLVLGSQSQTIIGRPILPDAAVHAVVEEHALDAKLIIFKKKRRKNYRRTNGHRQELTKLRITDIQGIEKPQPVATGKTEKTAIKKPEKMAVAA